MAQGQLVSGQIDSDAAEDTCTPTLPSPATAGNLIVIAARVGASGGVGVTTPTDFTAGPTELVTRGGIAMFAKIAVGGETAITVAAASTATIGAFVAEYEGPFNGSTPWDASNSGTSGNTQVTSQTSGTTGTLSQAAELVVACFGQIIAINTTDSYTNSLVEETGGDFNWDLVTNGSLSIASKIVAATTAVESTATFSATGRAKAAIWTFELGSAGAVTGTVAVTQAGQTSAASGSVGASAVTGTVAVTQSDQTSAASGTAAGVNPGGLPDAAVIAFYDARTLAGSPTDLVQNWANSGPNAQDPLTQATSGLRPAISDSGFGGVRSVEFDGVDNQLNVALDQTYSGDYAIICINECLTWPALSASAGVVYSTGAIPNKVILGYDDQGPSGWVLMVTGGAPEDHFTVTNDLAHLEDTPSRHCVTQYLQNSGLYKVWENGVILVDIDEGEALNNMPGMKVGMREDNSRPAHTRVGAILLVDMAETNEATLLAAQDELMAAFNVSTASDARTGTVAATQDAQTASADGTATPPEFTGTVAVTQADQTPDAEGDVVAAGFSGSVAVTQDDQTANAAGTFTPAPVTGTVAVTQGSQTADVDGTTTQPGFSGSVAATQDDQSGDADGTATPPAFTGTVAVTQDNQTSTATGEVVSAGFVGNLGVIQENQVSEATGVFTPAGITGTTAGTQDDQTSTISGVVANPAFTGTVGVTQEAQISVATGTTTAPGFTGTVNVTQDDQIGNASSPGLRTRLEGSSVSGFGAEGSPSGVGLEGTKL